MTLYELQGQWKQLYEMMDDPEIDEDAVLDTIEAIDGEIEIKAEGYAAVIKQLEADEEAIKKEIDRLSAMKKSRENNISRLKTNLQMAMESTGKYKFKSGMFSFNIQNNPPKLIVDDPASIPNEYLIPQEPKIDSKALKDFIKENPVPWAHLEQGQSLRIR